MAFAKKKAAEDAQPQIEIQGVDMAVVGIRIIGLTPLVPHAMSFKRGARELLFPSPKKNAAEKATSMKHEPFEEFREAAYKFSDEDRQPTRLYMPAGAFHTAMGAAAIDMPGAKRTQIGRLTSVPGILGGKVAIYGIPKIWSTIVRSSDMNRTPDVRTLPILSRWACEFGVEYVDALIKVQSVVNLLSAAGLTIGVGDGRPEKGKLAMGRFRVCDEDDKEWHDIVKHGGVKAQDAALANPAYFDLQTEELLTWFLEEKNRRHAAPAKSPRASKKSDVHTDNGGAHVEA